MTLKQLASSTAFLIRTNLVVAYLLDARLALLLLRWISFGLVCFVVAARNLRNSLIWITLLNSLAILLHVMGDPPTSPSSYLILDFIGSIHTHSIWKLLAVDLVIAGLQTLAAFATYLDQIPGYRARWYDHTPAVSSGPTGMSAHAGQGQGPDGPVDSDDEPGADVADGDWDGDEFVMDVTLGDLKRAWKGEPPRNDADFNPA